MLIRGLKAKMFSLYIVLILFMLGTSLSFIFTLLNMGKTINNLMQANYKSIMAAQNMIDALDKNQESILLYVVKNEEDGTRQFIESDRSFTSAYLMEKGNITEVGEGDAVAKIALSYDKYNKSFYALQEYRKNHDKGELFNYYYENISSQFKEVKDDCKKLLKLNEDAMFNLRNDANSKINGSILLNIIITIAAMIFGITISFYVLSNIFKPIHQLTDSVKSISEGNLSTTINIKTNDEIGLLATEFNNMTSRLEHYDQMNIKKLIDEKNKSIAIINSISEPIVVTDTDLKIVQTNPAFENIFETLQTKKMGKHIFDVIDNKKIYSAINNTMESNETYLNKKDNDVISINTKDSENYYKVMVTPILDKDNSIVGAVTVLQDITHMKEIENLKSEFVSTVSHEFRTPLTSISLGTGLLLDGTLGEISESQREIISAINEEEIRLADLVNDLLDLSRIESGKIAINMRPCSIEEIVSGTVHALLEQAKNKKINLSYYIEEKIPNVKADADKIKVVLTNLIGNALKFTPENGKIEVFVNYRDKKVFVSVKDTGIGIPREYREKIFEKFIQVKKDINNSMGSGLGLAISKKIIEIHGGEIWVESDVGKGSTFTFTIKAI